MMSGIAPVYRHQHRWPDLQRAPVLFVLGICVIYNCHLFRNLTPFYYGILGIAFAVCCIYVLSRMSKLSMTPIGICMLAYLFFAFSAVTQTFYDLGPVPAAYGGSRLLLTFPLAAMVMLVSGTYPKLFEYSLWLFVIFAVLGVLSLSIQYFTGPVSWFVEASDRAGVRRFGSFLGSIPVIGVILPLAVLLILLLPMKPLLRVGLLIAMCAGILLSLSKHAISGSVLAAAMGLYLARKQRISTVAWVLVGGVLGYLLLDSMDSPLLTNMRNYVEGVLFPSTAGADVMRGYDFTVQESMWLRLTSLPMESFEGLMEHRGSFGLVVGGGLLMLGQALVRPQDSPYITAHNNYMDFVLLGGVGYMVVYVALCYTVARESLRQYRAQKAGNLGGVMLGVSIMYLIAANFTAGLTYQPVLGCLWWSLVGFAWRFEINRMNLSKMKVAPAILRFRPKATRRVGTRS